MMKISVLVFVVLFELVYSRSMPGPTRNVTVAAMTTSQKCKDMFHECTETKECCGVDVQCAQYGAQKVCLGTTAPCVDAGEECKPNNPNECCSGACKHDCIRDYPDCETKNVTFCDTDSTFRWNCPRKCGDCPYRCVREFWWPWDVLMNDVRS